VSTILKQLAISGNRGAQQEFSVSIKVSKEIVPLQQAQVGIPNLGVRCKKWFNWTSGADKNIRL